MRRALFFAACASASLIAAAAHAGQADWWKVNDPSAEPVQTRAAIVKYYREAFPKLDLQDFALGSSAFNAELRKQNEQLAQFSPAGFVLDKGAKLWRQPLPDGKTYASCYPDGGKGVATHYPMYSEQQHEVVTLPMSLNACRAQHGAQALPYGKGDIVALETYLDSLSNGMPFDVKADSAEAVQAFQAGQKFFFRRAGQLDLACASCHVGAVGRYLRAQLLSASLGQAATFPKYRMKWGAVGTLQRRFRGCQKKIRAKPEAFESADYRNLQFFLTYLSDGIKLNVPGNGP
jgi:L-cysteine S-thiosulfotransferase